MDVLYNAPEIFDMKQHPLEWPKPMTADSALKPSHETWLIKCHSIDAAIRPASALHLHLYLCGAMTRAFALVVVIIVCACCCCDAKTVESEADAGDTKHHRPVLADSAMPEAENVRLEESGVDDLEGDAFGEFKQRQERPARILHPLKITVLFTVQPSARPGLEFVV
jgi:hypothetical protein